MTFDAESYDPFAHLDDRAEFWDRVDPVNQIPQDERTFTNAMADQISATDRLWIGPLDRDADAQALAQETIVNYRMAVGIAYPAAGVRRHDGQTEIANHGGPEYDPNDPTTFNRLYAILAGMPDQLIPLSFDYGWKDVANHRLAHYRICNVRISRHCDTRRGTERFAVKCGEFVPIYGSCPACLGWFDLDGFDRCATQSRPLAGFDFRNGSFRRDG